jgi:hypothetical protein
MMWGIFRVSSKLVATAALSIAIVILGFLFAPNLLSTVYDFADLVEDWLPTAQELNLVDLGGALYRQTVNDTMIFGILLTLIARIVVELVWGLFALAFGKKTKDADGTVITGGGGSPFDL